MPGGAGSNKVVANPASTGAMSMRAAQTPQLVGGPAARSMATGAGDSPEGRSSVEAAPPRSPGAALAWLTNMVGTVDLLYAFHQGNVSLTSPA